MLLHNVLSRIRGSRMSPPRSLLACCALTLGLIGLAGCGGTAGDAETAGSADADAGGDAFPVTITHALGTAEIEAPPERVVALSEGDQDAAIALGVQPVGMNQTLGDGKSLPWTEAELQDPRPTFLPVAENGVSAEQVAALEPDVILATADYHIDDEYDQLSRVAPTVAYETGPAEDPWQVTVQTVGEALGRSAEAEQLIADTEATLDAVAEDNPALAGKQFAIIQVTEPGAVGVLRSADDAGVKLLNQFGMELAPATADLPGTEFAARISLEQLELLDTEVLVGAFNGPPGLQEELERNPLFSQLDVVQRGSFVTMTMEEFWALRIPTVLGLPYLVEHVVPKLATAADAAG